MDARKIALNIRAEWEAEEILIAQRTARALAEANRLKADFLKIDPNMKRLVLFGSLAEGRANTPHFDIDLAVDSELYMKLVSRALDSEITVDLIDLNNVRPNILAEIERYGKILYEKK